MTVFIGLAFSASMLPPGTVTLRKEDLTVEEVKEVARKKNIVSCANPSHKATLLALKEKHGIEVPVPEKPIRVSLKSGDYFIVLRVSRLPRLTDRHEYTSEEIESAEFRFMAISVISAS